MAFAADADRVIQALDRYLKESIAADKPVLSLEPLGNIIEDLRLADTIQNGGLSEERLSAFVETYLTKTTRLHHPAYMAHQVAVPHYAGALGALINSVTNNAMAIYEMGPGATAIEYFMINWFLSKIGWEPAPTDMSAYNSQSAFGGGVLMHGGSLANLCALLVARQQAAPDAWENGNPPALVLLAPAGAHYSIARAVGILGMGQKAIVPLAVDDRGAIKPDCLKSTYDRMRDQGKRALALVANACSTAVGIYDPLDEIGDFCQERNLWLHVDGAHGASALLSPQHRPLLKDIHKANSVTWDAHKLLQTPILCAALLVRDHRHLDHTFQQDASYLFHEKEQPGFDFIHRTVECTKAGLGLKLFLVLAALGEKGLADTIEKQYALAQQAYTWINDQEGFSCPVAPQSNILCFRIEGSDTLQLKLRDRLLAQGRFYISTTTFNDTRYLRLVLINPLTKLEHIQQLIKEIGKLKKEFPSKER